MKLLRIFLFVIGISSCNGQPNTDQLQTNKDENTLLWEISGKGISEHSYLFGTFHLMCKADIQFSSALRSALVKAKELYLEVDLSDPANILGALLLLNMKDGKKLSDLYTIEEYRRVERFFKDSLKSSLTMFQSMKPSFLEAMLYPKMMPCKTISGVEQELMEMAKANKKKIRGLETMAFQAAVFDSIPYIDQAKELLKSIDSIEMYRSYFDTMVQVYKSQQLTSIESLFSKSEFGLEENRGILLDNRNKNWVEQLKTIMKKQPVFIAVGAGHLVGEMGLIALLRKEGYMLRPLKNER